MVAHWTAVFGDAWRMPGVSCAGMTARCAYPDGHETLEESTNIIEHRHPSRLLTYDMNSFEYIRRRISNSREGYFKLE